MIKTTSPGAQLGVGFLNSQDRPCEITSNLDEARRLVSLYRPSSSLIETGLAYRSCNMDSQQQMDFGFRELLCPISLQPIKAPVVLSSGHIYDKQSITYWKRACSEKFNLQTDGSFPCPMTRDLVNEIKSPDLEYLAVNLVQTGLESFELPVLNKDAGNWKHKKLLCSNGNDIGVHKESGNLSNFDLTTRDVQKIYPQDDCNYLKKIFENLTIKVFPSIEDMAKSFTNSIPGIISHYNERMELRTFLDNLNEYYQKKDDLEQFELRYNQLVEELKLKKEEAVKHFSEYKHQAVTVLQRAQTEFNNLKANLEQKEKEIEKIFFQDRPGDSPEYDRYVNTIIGKLKIPVAQIASELRKHELVKSIDFLLEFKKNMVDWLDGSRDKGSSYGVHINDVWTAIMVGGRLVAAPRIGNNNFDDRVSKLKLSEVEVSGDSERFSVAAKQPLRTFLESTGLDCSNFDELEAVQRFQTFYIPLQNNENSSVKFAFGFKSYSASKDNPLLLVIATGPKTCIYFVDQHDVRYYDGYVTNADGVKLTPFEIMNTKKYQQQFSATKEQVNESKFFKIMTIPLVKKDGIAFSPTPQCSSLSQKGHEVATQLNKIKEKNDEFLRLRDELFKQNTVLDSAKDCYEDAINQTVLKEQNAVDQVKNNIETLQARLIELNAEVKNMDSRQFEVELILGLNEQDRKLFDKGVEDFSPQIVYRGGLVSDIGSSADIHYRSFPSCSITTEMSLEESDGSFDVASNPGIQNVCKTIRENSNLYSSDASFALSKEISNLDYIIPNLRSYLIQGKGISVTSCAVKQLIGEKVASLCDEVVPKGIVKDMQELLTELTKAVDKSGRLDSIWNQGSQ